RARLVRQCHADALARRPGRCRGGGRRGAARGARGTQRRSQSRGQTRDGLPADRSAVHLPDPGGHLLRHRGRSRCGGDGDVRARARCSPDRTGDPPGRQGAGRGGGGVRLVAGTHPDRHPDPAGHALDHGRGQPDHHAVAVDGRHRRHGRHPGTGRRRVRGDHAAPARRRFRVRRERGDPRHLPRPHHRIVVREIRGQPRAQARGRGLRTGARERTKEDGMRIGRNRVLAAVFAGLLVAVTAACGGGGDGQGGGGGGDGGDLTIGYIAWDENIALANLFKAELDQRGFNVELRQLDVAPTWQAVAQGEIDLFQDAWLPTTHSDYWEQYRSQVEDLGVWYDQATLNIAVPSYVRDVNSIADLKQHADQFGGTITGIEPGAGETRLVETQMMPDYGLEGSMTLQKSSTTAMLS